MYGTNFRKELFIISIFEPIEIIANSRELIKGVVEFTPYESQIKIAREIDTMAEAMKKSGLSEEQIRWIFQEVKKRKKHKGKELHP